MINHWSVHRVPLLDCFRFSFSVMFLLLCALTSHFSRDAGINMARSRTPARALCCVSRNAPERLSQSVACRDLPINFWVWATLEKLNTETTVALKLVMIYIKTIPVNLTDFRPLGHLLLKVAPVCVFILGCGFGYLISRAVLVILLRVSFLFP